VKYTSQALRSAAELTARYINDRHLPDKAIDIIDEAGARQRLSPPSRRKKTIGAPEIEEIVAKVARIPPKSVSTSDREVLQHLERNLKMVVFGQDEAIEMLATAIKMARSGLGQTEKPIGSFLFAGPTGVGKTEVTRQLARVLGIELVRFDMSEYMERHTVSRLIGAPPGYVGYDTGGLLTEAINKQPHAVLLLDEIEKAHPDVFNVLLQVMDHGTLTDANGRKTDFRNVIVVMTTNAGADRVSRASIGFAKQDHSSDAIEEIKRMFSPEFRNRLDAIIQRAGSRHHRPRRRQVHHRTGKPARCEESHRGGGPGCARLVGRARLRSTHGCAADGASHQGEDQKAAGRRAALWQSGAWRPCQRRGARRRHRGGSRDRNAGGRSRLSALGAASR